MTLHEHVMDAGSRLEKARFRLEKLQAKTPTIERLQQEIDAIRDCIVALSEIQSYNNESIHEKLHKIANVTHVEI